MKNLSESILDDDQTIKNKIYLHAHTKLAEKLAQKFEKAKNNVGDDFYDNLGQKLELGDIVVTINDTFSVIGCITNMRDPDDKECMMIYFPYYQTEKSIFPFDVIKLDRPEKYLK